MCCCSSEVIVLLLQFIVESVTFTVRLSVHVSVLLSREQLSRAHVSTDRSVEPG